MATETLAALIKGQQKQLKEKENSKSTSSRNLPQPTVPTATTQASADFHSKALSLLSTYPTGTELLAAYNPDHITDVMRITDLSRIYEGNAPELSLVTEAYGRDTAETWIEIQLQYLSEFVGASDKLTETQTSFLSAYIITRYGGLKMSEFMLFIGRVMSGHYGHFYGSVDVQQLMSFLFKFANERADECNRIRAARTKEIKSQIEGQKEFITSDQWPIIKPQVMDEYLRLLSTGVNPNKQYIENP